MKAQACNREEGDQPGVKVIEQDGQFYVVKVLPLGDASGETFPTPTAQADGASLRRYIAECRDDKTARRQWDRLA